MSKNNNNPDFTNTAGQSAFFSDSNRSLDSRSSDVSDQTLLNLVELPADAPISGDEVDGGVFKELYPQIERDEATGESYRPISRVSALQSMQQRDGEFDLDVLAIEEGRSDVNGAKQGAYLFTTRGRKAGQEQVSKVVVDAHGAFKVPVCEEITLQPGVPAIVFLGPHGKILDANLGHIYNVYAEVSFEGITLMSEQARDDFNAFGHERITGTSTIGAIRNYELGKFKEKEQELGPQQGKHYFEFVVAYMHLCRIREESQRKLRKPLHEVQQAFDMIELRKKGPNLSTRDMVRIAQEQGYAQVIFSFCRSPLQARRSFLASFFQRGKNKPEVYKAASTKQLETPLFYSWDDVKKLEMEKARVSGSQEAPSCSAPRMSG